MSTEDQIKVFTLEEAEKLLPALTSLIQRLHLIRDEISKLEVDIDALELVGAKDKPSADLERQVEIYNQAVTQFYEMVDEIHRLGCYLKDVDLGLIDFYAMREGKVVYLCWKLGEAHIAHWHDVGEGFGSRQPLNPGKP